MNKEKIDFDSFYKIDRMDGIAWSIIEYATNEVYEGDYLVCEDENCDHAGSEMCWIEGDWSIVKDYDNVIAVMVGDNQRHTIDVDDLAVIDEDDFCFCCGQIGCKWN